MKKLGLFVLIIAIDQITKLLSTKGLLLSVGDFFVKTVCNPYLALGIPLPKFIFFSLWVGVILIFVWLMRRLNWPWLLLMVLAAALSNMIDRIRLGCVIDFIRLPLGEFPLVNLADMIITLGIFIFLLSSFFKRSSLKI